MRTSDWCYLGDHAHCTSPYCTCDCGCDARAELARVPHTTTTPEGEGA